MDKLARDLAAPAANRPAEPGVRARVRLWHLPRSAAFRFALIYAGLLALSASALAGFLWWETVGVLDRQTRAAIVADIEDLLQRAHDDGMEGLADAIQDRLNQNVPDDAVYLLASPWMKKLEGNLERWPAPIDPIANVWIKLPIERDHLPSVAVMQAMPLDGGYHLIVGRDVQLSARLDDLFGAALLWSLPILVALASIGALVIRSLFDQTIESISATANAVAAGNLSRRVRLSGRGDEFDQLAETINHMLDRIGRLMDGVRQVSNSIAHDLRTPIARARARIEAAARSALGEEELRAALERATADLDQVAELFQALLRIAEIEAGGSRRTFATFDLAPLLADLAELYGAVAEEAGVQLVLAAPDQLSCFGDRPLVQQGVANLVDNAIKFSPPEGRIVLGCRARSDGAEIEVQDQGPGMPECDIERATERFFRGESARHTPGSGLGLALVQAVATLHHGTLRLANTHPGLRATLWLPGRDSRPTG